MSCKYIGEKIYIWAFIFDNENQIHFLSNKANNDNYFCVTCVTNDLNEYVDLAIYDTISAKTKILCKSYNNRIICNFVNITIYNSNKPISGNIQNIGQQNLTFILNSNDFSEKDCSYSEFNNEHLFCCGIDDYII